MKSFEADPAIEEEVAREERRRAQKVSTAKSRVTKTLEHVQREVHAMLQDPLYFSDLIKRSDDLIEKKRREQSKYNNRKL